MNVSAIIVLAGMALIPILAVIGVFALVAALNRKNCPQCGYKLPMRRKPANREQAMWGGWTCPGCGAELDREARAIPAR